jgi:hypothetical protein
MIALATFAINLYLAISTKYKTTVEDILAGVLVTRIKLIMLISAIHFVVLIFDTYYIIQYRVLGCLANIMLEIDDDSNKLVAVFFFAMAYLTFNFTVPIVHIILTNNLYKKVKVSEKELNAYTNISDTSRNVTSLPGDIECVQV